MLPGDDDDDELTFTKEEQSITDEIVGHPTRDDWHEQREDGQECEGVLHVHAHATVVTIRVMRTSMPHSVTRR